MSTPSPFEWDAPLLFTEKLEIAVGCILLLPIRVLATVVCAGLGALWCQLIFFTFSIFGKDPSKHGPKARRARVLLLRYPCMVIQRIWLFALGFWWIEVTGHDVWFGVWWGRKAKVIVANHTSILDMLIMVWQHNPSFLGKRAILSIPLIGTVGFVNEMIAVDREAITSKGGVTASTQTTKEKIVAHINDPNAPPLLVFPEGTTCRNDALIQFKAGGAFAHSEPVQPMILRYRKREPCGLKDTFDYSSTPATNTKLWALRFLSRLYHNLTITYLPPIAATEANGLKDKPVAFANACRDSMSAAMGPAVRVTDQSYEEFFIFKTWCERFKQPGFALRSLDFKRAKRAIGAVAAGAEGAGEANTPAAPEALSLDAAQATLAAFRDCLARQPRSSARDGDGSFRATAAGLGAALELEPARAEALFAAVAAESGALADPTAGPTAGRDSLGSLDFMEFLVGLHRSRPEEALARGWLTPRQPASP